MPNDFVSLYVVLEVMEELVCLSLSYSSATNFLIDLTSLLLACLNIFLAFRKKTKLPVKEEPYPLSLLST